MTETSNLRPWSSLAYEEQTDLLVAYQPVVDCDGPTCSFDVKMARMAVWLRDKGISITEAEIRNPRAKSTNRSTL